MTLAEQYSRLKKAVGGNREKMRYEDTFGMPMEEKQHITPPNRWNRRILGELDFAIRLSEENGHAYDDCIGQALALLQTRMNEEGVLTNASCQAAEELLAPCAAAAKEYGLILVAHSHIDMNWTWGYHETVAIVLNTFRTMLEVMKEYPDFCFSQSQASVYQIVEQHDPEMMKEIQARIREGRWEVNASTWVEMDKNMPNTESLIHQTRCAKEYLESHWGVDPDSVQVDFCPDTFGHPRNYPEIDRIGGLKYYYFCRGLSSGEVLFRWKAASGEEILCYREPYWYNSAITPHIGVGLIDLSRRCAGLKTGMAVYGVGDHGGGPTRRDVERAYEMMEWPIYPRLKFGTMKEFFAIAEEKRAEYPLVDHHMNYTAPGCLVTQSRVKLGNRQAERALYEAEAWSALSPDQAKLPWRKDRFAEAWQKVLFNQFHDILTGSCVTISRECAVSTYSEALAIAHTEQNKACRAIAEQIDSSFAITEEDLSDSQAFGAGPGYGFSGASDLLGQPVSERGMGMKRLYHIFNSSGHERTQTVEITVWDWQGDLRRAYAATPDGTEIRIQILDNERKWYWDHMYFRFLAEVTVPAMGYATILFGEKETEQYPFYYQPDSSLAPPYTNPVLENEYIRAEFDFKNGGMVSLVDKETATELVKPGDSGRMNVIWTEYVSSNGWNVGRHLNTEELQTTRIYPNVSGALRNGFVIEQQLGDDRMTTTISLDAHAKAVRFQLKIDWPEHGREGEPKPAPVLSFGVPVAYPAEEVLHDIPAGAYSEPAAEIEIPGLTYASAVNKNGASLFLSTDCKYGYRLADDVLSVALINTSHSPDPYSDYGIHEITIYAGASPACPKTLWETAADLLHPLTYLSVRPHKGELPAESSLLGFDSETAILSSVTRHKDGDLLVCCYETCGAAAEVRLTLPTAVSAACFVDSLGRTEEGEVTIDGTAVRFSLGANALRIVKIHAD